MKCKNKSKSEKENEIEKYLQRVNSEDTGSIVRYENGKFISRSAYGEENERRKSL